MRDVDRGAFQQGAIGSRRIDLSGVTAQRVDAGIEGLHRTFGGIHRQRTRHQSRAVQVFDREHVVQRERGRSLRAVEKRETFFSLQRERCETGGFQSIDCRSLLAFDKHLANAQQHARHMRERREVARCAHRTLSRE
jgi:hypothetical protein